MNPPNGNLHVRMPLPVLFTMAEKQNGGSAILNLPFFVFKHFNKTMRETTEIQNTVKYMLCRLRKRTGINSYRRLIFSVLLYLCGNKGIYLR